MSLVNGKEMPSMVVWGTSSDADGGGEEMVTCRSKRILNAGRVRFFNRSLSSINALLPRCTFNVTILTFSGSISCYLGALPLSCHK